MRYRFPDLPRPSAFCQHSVLSRLECSKLVDVGRFLKGSCIPTPRSACNPWNIGSSTYVFGRKNLYGQLACLTSSASFPTGSNSTSCSVAELQVTPCAGCRQGRIKREGNGQKRGRGRQEGLHLHRCFLSSSASSLGSTRGWPQLSSFPVLLSLVYFSRF